MKKCELKKNNNKNGIIMLRFVTSYSILLIFVLIMGLFLYQYGVNDAKNNLHKQNSSLLHKSAATLDESVNLMNALVTQISNNNDLRSLVKMNNTKSAEFQTTAKNTMTYLTDLYPLEKILPLHEYYIYLPKLDYVLSSSMLSELRPFYKYNKSFDQVQYSDWLTMFKSSDNYRQLIDLSEYSMSSFHSFLYKVPLSTSYLSGTIDAIVCFEVSLSELKSIFSPIDLFKTGFLIAEDNDNEVFRISSAETKEASVQALMNKIKTKRFNQSKDFIELKLDHESVVVTMTPSNNGQWTYYLVQPSDLVFEGLNKYQNAYRIIIAFTCLLFLALVFYLAKRNMRPILEIKSELASSRIENNTLALKLEEQRPMIYNSYMARIMKGMIADENEANEIMSFLQLSESNMKYSVLYASVREKQMEMYMEDSIPSSELKDKQNDYRDIIRFYLYKYFGDDIYIYEADINSFAILLATNSSISMEDYNQSIKTKFNELHDALIKEQSIWIFGGLGNRNYQLSYLWKSYQQAIQAISYIHEGNVFQAFTEIKREKDSYYYPVEMAQQLSNFIHTGNTKQVQEIFRLVRKENFEEVSLPMTYIKWLLSDIRNTLLKVRFPIAVTNENQDILNEIDAAFQESKTLERMEDISLKLCSLNEKKTEGNRLIANIQTYIKNNYHDSSLSLKKISEEFNISESYFSYLFKAETKQNFSEYLELIRMDQAMVLLKTTDINICDMYLELGYNNVNSFRRAFKKIHGVSPKMIREAKEIALVEPN